MTCPLCGIDHRVELDEAKTADIVRFLSIHRGIELAAAGIDLTDRSRATLGSVPARRGPRRPRPG